MTFDEIVSAYIRCRRDIARAEMVFFEKQPDLPLAIRFAALCRCSDGKRHSHQRRISLKALKQAERKLQTVAEALKQAPDFATLYRIVNCTIGPIHGIGKERLTVYDVAHRVGAFLGKAPVLVYLHAGTKKGATKLGFRGKKTIRPDDLPIQFSRLTAAEIEDCLCHYRDRLCVGGIRT